MRVYTYSEAKQRLSSVLEDAETNGKVLIRRKDGRTFALTPERTKESPLDVAPVPIDISAKEIVDLVRKERRRTRYRKS